MNYKYPEDIEFCKSCMKKINEGILISECIAKKDEHCPNINKWRIYAQHGHY
jgi:hypothetical protein